MITRSVFDTLPDGRRVECYRLQNSAGMSVRLLTIGAAMQSVKLPDHSNAPVSVALGYDTAEEYLHTKTFAGAICGRVANRVGGAAFTLNERTYRLPANDGPNQLHGGENGFYRQIWDAKTVENGVAFSLESPDGDQGYPGRLRVAVTYTLSENNVLAVDYEAVSDQDTLCNLTNHSYWNMAGYGRGCALSQKVQIFSDFFTPINEKTLPTGEIAAVRGPFDLREGKIAAEGKSMDDSQIALVGGYDHNFVLRDYKPGRLGRAALLTDPDSGRQMEIDTTMPGLQYFSGMELADGHTGLALETQCFPDAMHHWWFPSVILRRNHVWRSRTEYRFRVS